MSASARALLHSLTLVVCDDEEEACRWTAERLEQRIVARPDIVLGLATGNTQARVYALLAERHRLGALSFARVRSFNLDEYVGLPPDHPSSFAAYMREHLFSHVDIRSEFARVPDGMANDLDATARAYEAEIRTAGGIDLQLLGIGRNGHIGFNEPGTAMESRTRRVGLTASTRQANARDFPAGETTPAEAVTMGIGTIMEAREILLLATGSHKAEAIARTLYGPVDDACPASALRRHPAATIVCDRAAASRLGLVGSEARVREMSQNAAA